jgi:hypothetical protein
MENSWRASSGAGKSGRSLKDLCAKRVMFERHFRRSIVSFDAFDSEVP